jgi:broad specificity phosphatase PhoE
VTVLHLVRHGQPDVQRLLPAHEWRLAEQARGEMLALRESGALPASASWSSSPEPKAVETARFLADGEIVTVHAFREQIRSGNWLESEAEYRNAVRTAFEHPQSPALPGWEPLDRTRERVTSAVLHLVANASRPQLIAVGHGTAWTVLVSQLTGSAPDLDAWESMLMPDHCVLDLTSGMLMKPWGSWALR